MFDWAPKLRQCPNSYLEDIWEQVDWWTFWKRFGLLPHPGGLGQQPAFVTQVIMEYERALAEISEEHREKEEKQREKDAKEAMRRNRGM